MSDDSDWDIDFDRSEAPATRDEIWDLFLHQSKVNLSLIKILLKMKNGISDELDKDAIEAIKINSELIALRDKLIIRQDEDEQ